MIAAQLSHAPVTISRARLAPPHIAGVAIRRPELLARLDRALSVPLTLVVAPAGHGKTRTLVEWSEPTGGATDWLSMRGNPTLLLASAWVSFLSGHGGCLDARWPDLSIMPEPGLLDEHQQAETGIRAFGAAVAVDDANRGANEVTADVLPRPGLAHHHLCGIALMMISPARSQEGFPEEGLAQLEASTITGSARVMLPQSVASSVASEREDTSHDCTVQGRDQRRYS